MNSMISNDVPIAEGRRYAIGSAQGTPFVGFFGDRCFSREPYCDFTQFTVGRWARMGG
jgi:hypothetical protein